MCVLKQLNKEDSHNLKVYKTTNVRVRTVEKVMPVLYSEHLNTHVQQRSFIFLRILLSFSESGRNLVLVVGQL